jgi:hypothetical protein
MFFSKTEKRAKVTDTVKLNSWVYGIKVSGDIAYLANGHDGLQIMNIHNPSQLLGVANTPGYAYDIAVNGNTVYIVGNYSGLQIIDVSDANNPFISDFLELPYDVYGIAISEDIAYVANDYRGLQVLDIRMPTKPYKVATIQTNHPARGLSVVDDKLYIVGDQYLSVLPVANIEIEAYINNLMKLNSSPLTFSGEYHLKVYNPKSSDTADYSVLPPFLVSEVSAALSGNSAIMSIPFDITEIYADISIQDCSITACSLNQSLISTNNIAVTTTEFQNILQIKPTANQFGTAIIELRITNGNVYQVERFTISVQFSEIEISTITPAQGILGEALKLTVTGTGFDHNTKVIMIPENNSNIKIFNAFNDARDVEIVDNIAYVALCGFKNN